MDNKVKLVILAYFILLAFDKVILSDARRLLLDFLIGQRSRKNAKRIHAEQTMKDRLHMGYIYPMLKKHQKSFHRHHILYLVVLYSILPQYTAVILFHIFAPSIVGYIFGILLILRFLLACYYRLELGPLRMSVYAKKKK